MRGWNSGGTSWATSCRGDVRGRENVGVEQDGDFDWVSVGVKELFFFLLGEV